ncbi:MAG TPA: restriction endonuclease subunit S [Bacteroidales bacterium]|nr:restriction endonuclease subunit S [Bacteroidales bacterium]
MKWEKVKLGSICDFISGNAWSASDFQSTGEIPIIRIQNLNNSDSSFVYWNKPYDRKFIIQKGDMLLSLSGSIKIDIWQGEECLLNQRIIKIETKENIDKRWLFWSLLNKISSIERMGKWALVNNVSITDLREINIDLPPLPTQLHIASILDHANNLRQLNKQLLQKYDELAQSLFIEMFGENVAKTEQWPVVHIKDIAAKHKGSMRTGPFGSTLLHSEFVNKGIAVLGIDNAVNNRFEWSERRYITEEKFSKLKNYQVFPEDIIITIMGTLGRCAVIPEDIPVAINTKHLAAITLDKNVSEPEFIAFSIRNNQFLQNQLKLRNRGAIMDGLNLGIIKELKMYLPPLKLQKEFIVKLKNIQDQKRKLTCNLEKSENLFQSLMQRAFNSELIN